MDTVKRVLDFINQPFKTPLDTVHIFLLVGIVIASAILWGRVLSHLRLE